MNNSKSQSEDNTKGKDSKSSVSFASETEEKVFDIEEEEGDLEKYIEQMKKEDIKMIHEENTSILMVRALVNTELNNYNSLIPTKIKYTPQRVS